MPGGLLLTMVTPMALDVATGPATGPATVTTGLMSTAIIKAVNRATGIVTGAGITTETKRDISIQPGLQSGITFETDCSAYVQLTGLNW